MTPSPSSFELDFERRLSALELDARQCAAYAYTDFAQSYYENDFAVLDRLRKHAGFWNRVRGAMQLATFITVARLFDRDSGNDSIRETLRFAEQHPGLFKREALRLRKERQGVSPLDAAKFVDDIPEHSQSVWRGLSDALRQKEQVFSEKVAPIRHKVFAHAGRIGEQERDALFYGLMLRTLEELCVFPLQVSVAIGDYYRDGRLPTLATQPPTIITEVMNNLPKRYVNTWDHLHVAKDAAQFFEWLKTTQLDDEDESNDP